jgi:hypothetical protein
LQVPALHAAFHPWPQETRNTNQKHPCPSALPSSEKQAAGRAGREREDQLAS